MDRKHAKLGRLPGLIRFEPLTATPLRHQSDPHYQTPEHRAWRAEVYRRAGGKCQGSGPHGGRLIADHIVEIKDGGARLDPENGRLLCQFCHNRKTPAFRASRMGANLIR